MNTVDFSRTKITNGFWKQKQDMLRNVTVGAVYDRFKETGRFEAFECNWKEGDPLKPHIFWDSDVAKWIEGVAYLLEEATLPEAEAVIDKVVSLIEKNRLDNGYFNSYFITVEPDKIFTERGCHELYCAGHLIEAAIAYANATGKKRFLELMCDYVDYIEKRFVTDADTGFSTPGHEEIELALLKLYEVTGNEKHLALAKHFIDKRGCSIESSKPRYDQSHLPVREQTTAEGHAVRAIYLFCGMADLAYHTGDKELLEACETLFENIITKRMYITGGIGSSSMGEAFTVDYDLSNILAYTETCAALGLALFANRMLKFDANSKYSDTIERVIYNGFLSSVSLDGRSFFYENPLEILPYLKRRDVSEPTSSRKMHFPGTTRKEVFDCSCCPPNILRFIASIGNFLYSASDNTLFVHQYMNSETETVVGGKRIKVTQKTNFPESGKLELTVNGSALKVAVRIPYWCKSYTGETTKGYAYFDLSDGETLSLDLGMPTVFIEARPEAIFDCGRYAVMRGPVVYCMESIDNGEILRDIRLDGGTGFEEGIHPTLGVPTLKIKAYRRKKEENAPLYRERKELLEETKATLIPYYAFANRGECEMQVWHFVK